LFERKRGRGRARKKKIFGGTSFEERLGKIL